MLVKLIKVIVQLQLVKEQVFQVNLTKQLQLVNMQVLKIKKNMQLL
jgi:hypothetical protein